MRDIRFGGGLAVGAGGDGAAAGAGNMELTGGSPTGNPVCPANQQLCSGVCVDLASDPLNCGVCGAACESGQTCQAGTCQCQAGLVDCAGSCVDTQSDGLNCGVCGNVCPPGQVCSSGRCGTSCAAGETLCGSSCVDLTSSVLHCGDCDTACAAGQSCSAGQCVCANGQQLCDGECVALDSDPLNCGACGNVCSEGQSCISGVCSGDTGGGGAGGSGGAATGGAGTAGAATGGTGTGGTATGGTGGEATGGAATGGTFELDCGPNGWAVEAHGPPDNRVNYAIVGDGYLAADLVAGGAFEQHINRAMAKRFSVPIGEPYSRYRNFVNICAIKLESTSGICNGSALGCCGNDSTRLASCDSTAANEAFADDLPASFVIDWKAVVLNGDSWWNTGSALMLWSGGHSDAPGAALHEGGHGFHQLADEYGGNDSNCTTEYAEVNSTADPTNTAGKWDLWLNYDQAGATGLQTTLEGSRYCDTGQYRPSSNSMMNMLFGDNPDTSFNSVSREQMIFTIWRAVEPIDSTTPPAGAVSNPSTLTVEVIDPAVIDVDWSVDGSVVAAKGGESFDVAAHNLSSGSHTVTATAYDNASDDWVRNRSGTCPASVTGRYCARTAWTRAEQTVTWTVTIP